MDKPAAKTLPHQQLRNVARDMAALLELMMEFGNIPGDRVLPLLDRWAQAEHMIDSDDSALRVRVNKLVGVLEADFITARITTTAPDARCLVTVSIAREWMAGAFREAIVQVRNHFPDYLPQRIGDAYAHVH